MFASDRKAYLVALNRGSIDADVRLFTAFLAERVSWSMEKHDLEFPDKTGKEDFDRDTVVFFGQDGKKRVRCAISREALDDDFAGDNRDKVEVFLASRKVIEEAARRKYLAGDTQEDGSILIHSGDSAHAKR